MGQDQSSNKNLNILVFGITFLVSTDKVESDWRKDQVNSCIDFDIYINSSFQPHIMLWCPKQQSILQQTIEATILNIDFEGVLYIFETQSNLKNHRNIVKWLMSEDTMRQCSLILLAIVPSDDKNTYIKQLITSELDLESMDSKQARNLMIYKFDGNDMKFNKLIGHLLKMKNES